MTPDEKRYLQALSAMAARMGHKEGGLVALEDLLDGQKAIAGVLLALVRRLDRLETLRGSPDEQLLQRMGARIVIDHDMPEDQFEVRQHGRLLLTVKNTGPHEANYKRDGIEVPVRYFSPEGKMSPQGGAYVKGAKAALAGQPDEHPYANEVRGFAKAWREGWTDHQ